MSARRANSDRPRRGWDPNEPRVLALALLLLLVSGFLPWWGFEEDVSRVPYTRQVGIDLGPWLTDEWELQVLPGTVRRDSQVRVWWEFVDAHPEFGEYAAVAAALTVLWSLAMGSSVVALAMRARRGSRRGGWPTLLQAVAAVATGLAVGVSLNALPAVAGFGSPVGSADPFAWGPKVGWAVGLVAAGLFSLSTALAWRTDRVLEGRCWKCYREAEGPECPHCGTVQ